MNPTERSRQDGIAYRAEVNDIVRPWNAFQDARDAEEKLAWPLRREDKPT